MKPSSWINWMATAVLALWTAAIGAVPAVAAAAHHTAPAMASSKRSYISAASQVGASTGHAMQSSDSVPSRSVGVIENLHMFSARNGWAFAAMNSRTRLLRTTDGGRRWVAISPPPVKAGVIVGHVFVNPNTVWIAVQSQPMNSFATQPLRFLRTQDGGRTWQTVSSFTLPNGMPVQSVQFDLVTLTAGFVMVQPQHGMGSEPGLLYAVSGAGKRFSLRSENLYAYASTKGNRLPDGGSIYFSSLRVGWLVAADCTTCTEHLYETANGGKNWRRIPLPAPRSDRGRTPNLLSAPFSPVTGGALYLAAFMDGNVGLNPSALYRYDSAAHHWIYDGVLPDNYGSLQMMASRPSYVDFTSAANGYVMGTNRLYETVDGGRNWSPVPGGPQKPTATAALQEIDFVSKQTGWILWNTYPANGKDVSVLYESVDGGHSWKLILRTAPTAAN